MHDLVGEAGDEQPDLVAGEGIDGRCLRLQLFAAPVRLCPIGRGERGGQHVLQLTHMALGLAALAVVSNHRAMMRDATSNNDFSYFER